MRPEFRDSMEDLKHIVFGKVRRSIGHEARETVHWSPHKKNPLFFEMPDPS
jgi:hypothetical protein